MLTRRLKKEYDNVKSDLELNSKITFISDDIIQEWEVEFYGRRNTLFENGIFKLSVKFPTEYPFKPPIVKFLTKVYHPNINMKGEICLNTLHEGWSASLTLRSILGSIISLLYSPNPNDPLVSEIAEMFKNDRRRYDDMVREWVRIYAM